jgi:hypothetical protein
MALCSVKKHGDYFTFTFTFTLSVYKVEDAVFSNGSSRSNRSEEQFRKTKEEIGSLNRL